MNDYLKTTKKIKKIHLRFNENRCIFPEISVIYFVYHNIFRYLNLYYSETAFTIRMKDICNFAEKKVTNCFILLFTSLLSLHAECAIYQLK